MVVEEQQDVVSCGQSHQHRTVVMVIRRSGACGLLCPQPVLVVSVGVRSRLVGQDRVIVAGKVQSPPGESSERIVCICHYLTICKGDRQEAIVSVVGIDRVPALPGDRTDQFCQVVVHVVFVTVGGDGTSVRDAASRTRERLLRHGHASSCMVVFEERSAVRPVVSLLIKIAFRVVDKLTGDKWICKKRKTQVPVLNKHL